MKIKSWGNFFKKDVDVIKNGNQFKKHVVRGAGLSYNDSAIYSTVKFSNKNTFLIDISNKEITVSAGVLLKDISQALESRGYILPVTPGTELITAGGAFASNIHGKSHHIYGCFSDNVSKIKFLDENNRIQIAINGSERFSQLAGSFGLLFEITELTLLFKKVDSNILNASNKKCKDIFELIECFNANINSTYTVAWFDSNPTLKDFGRGVFMSADVDSSAKTEEKKNHIVTKIPSAPSFLMKNKNIVSLMNAIYYKFSKDGTFKVNSSKYLYPLDKYAEWDGAYGAIGMFQFQCAIPESNIVSFIKEMQETMLKNKMVSFVSVLKKFGNTNQRSPLDFQLKNSFTIAMDFSASENNIIGAKILNSLVTKYAGRVYLAKDAFLTPFEFSRQYQSGETFLDMCEILSEKTNLTSDLFKRLRG